MEYGAVSIGVDDRLWRNTEMCLVVSETGTWISTLLHFQFKHTGETEGRHLRRDEDAC